MDRHENEWRSDHFDMTSSFPSDGGALHHHRHHNYNGESNDSSGSYFNINSDNSMHLSGQKRQFFQTDDVDYGYVKLYVVGVPRTATAHDISEVFGQFGDIVEVVLLKDKRTGFQQECCFVKYANLDQAELAIAALHGQDLFSGDTSTLQVKYAVGELDRLGSFGTNVHKLYVGCLNRQATRWDIEEIFSPFGVIEEIFVVRDEFRNNRGCAFVRFSCRDMAIAAIQALHGIYVMRGCDQPLIVRFADPKKPRFGDSRPAPYFKDNSSKHMFSNETQQMKSSNSGCNMSSSITGSIANQVNSIYEKEQSIECDWSEHVSPDGDLYYYNCVTCESRWEMPEEYALYEQKLDNLEQHQQQQQESNLEALFSPDDVSQAQEG